MESGHPGRSVISLGVFIRTLLSRRNRTCYDLNSTKLGIAHQSAMILVSWPIRITEKTKICSSLPTRSSSNILVQDPNLSIKLGRCSGASCNVQVHRERYVEAVAVCYAIFRRGLVPVSRSSNRPCVHMQVMAKSHYLLASGA